MEALDEEDREDQVFRDFIEKMEKFARSLGLYMGGAYGRRRPMEEYVLEGTDQRVMPFVSATFILGDEAFDDRVQHPERYTDDAVLGQIEHATLKLEAEDIMKKFLLTGKVFDDD